jgi:hypothetical protein
VDKVGLIGAALRRIEDQHIALVAPDPSKAPGSRLRVALRQIAEPHFLTTEPVTLRLQLWALARMHEEFEYINAEAQQRYRAGLSRLIRAALPALSRRECDKRAEDIDILQNGMSLTARRRQSFDPPRSRALRRSCLRIDLCATLPLHLRKRLPMRAAPSCVQPLQRSWTFVRFTT